MTAVYIRYVEIARECCAPTGVHVMDLKGSLFKFFCVDCEEGPLLVSKLYEKNYKLQSDMENLKYHLETLRILLEILKRCAVKLF